MSCGNPAQAEENGEPEQNIMPKRPAMPARGSRTCQRCREARSKFIVRSALYCRACFEMNIRQRFLRQLFPSLRPDEKRSKNPSKRDTFRPPVQSGNAVIALSGGAGSMTMLEMLTNGGFLGKGDGKRADLTKGEKEVLWDHAIVVHVDFSGVVQGLEDRTEWLRGIAKGKGLRLVALKAEDVFDPHLAVRLGGEPREGREDLLEVTLRSQGLALQATTSSDPPLESLRRLVSSLPAASRPALFSHIVNSLLDTVCRCRPDVSHLLLGETATRQAQRIISGTALGRGWSLPLELASSLEGEGYTRVLPMKDITVKEASFQCHLRGYDTRNHRNWSTREGHRGSRGNGATSLEGLTEQFIAGLSVTHPATVSTITRTGDKLVFPGQDRENDVCPFCQMPVDPNPLVWKSKTALTSLDASSKLSGEPGSRQNGERGLADLLCYACLTTMTVPMSGKRLEPDEVALPIWVGERFMSRTDMRSSISEFIIDRDS